MSQIPSLGIEDIDPSLMENANSVVLEEKIKVEIPEIDKQIITKYRAVVVFNKNGNQAVNAYEAYDESIKVKEVRLSIYDKSGEELKNYKKRDFQDYSAVAGGTLYSESRVLVADYSPKSYPYIAVFESKVESNTTAFISPYFPVSDYYSAIINSEYTIGAAPDLEIKYKAINNDENSLQITQTENVINISSNNVKALIPEDLGLSKKKFFTQVLFGLNYFSLKGVKGEGKDWSTFGKWINESLLAGTNDIPETTKQEIIDLVKDVPTDVEKAKLVYQYMQDRTRYISVQVGIGGWKPMMANEVDELGYGDCKALTNYTKALMDVAGVQSYYTIINASNDKEDITENFTAIQGNHVILALPQNDESIVWLECTNQQVPFGYIGASTDDRNALVIKPEGGEIIKTKKYELNENKFSTIGTVRLNEEHGIKVEAQMTSSGVLYGQHYGLESIDEKDRNKYYKNYWDYIDNIEIQSIEVDNNKDQVLFTESVVFDAESYATEIGEEIIVPINVVNRSNYVPSRYKERKQPLVISRGYNYQDIVTIEIPMSNSIKFIPDAIRIEEDFGKYEFLVEKINETELRYTRYLEIREGIYPREQYKNYRSFRRKVTKGDNQKIILTK